MKKIALWAAGVLIGLVMLFAVLMATCSVSVPYYKAARKVSLKPSVAPRPVSKEAWAFVALANKMPSASPAESAMWELPEKLAWPTEAALKNATATTTLLRKRFLKAMRSPGCYPSLMPLTAPDKGRPKVEGLFFLRGIRAVGSHAVLLGLQGQPDHAARNLMAIADRLEAYENHCRRLLIDQMIWFAARGMLMGYFAYLVVHPALSTRSVAAILNRLFRWSNAELNPVTDTLRYEARWALSQLDKVSHDAPSGFWPWYSEDRTKTWMRSVFQIAVHRSRRPVNAAFWKDIRKDRLVTSHYNRLGGLGEFLQYNADGLTLVMELLRTHTRYILLWHHWRCIASARRAQLIQFIRRHRVVIAAKLDQAAPVNSLTGGPFASLTAQVCAVTGPGGRVWHAGVWLVKLPTIPTPANKGGQ